MHIKAKTVCRSVYRISPAQCYTNNKQSLEKLKSPDILKEVPWFITKRDIEENIQHIQARLEKLEPFKDSEFWLWELN